MIAICLRVLKPIALGSASRIPLSAPFALTRHLLEVGVILDWDAAV